MNVAPKRGRRLSTESAKRAAFSYGIRTMKPRFTLLITSVKRTLGSYGIFESLTRKRQLYGHIRADFFHSAPIGKSYETKVCLNVREHRFEIRVFVFLQHVAILGSHREKDLHRITEGRVRFPEALALLIHVRAA